MSDALTEVLVRRERLLQRIARQRDGVAVAVRDLRRPIAIVDRVVEGVRVLRAHPAAAIGVAAAILVLRARTVIGLVGRGIGVWRLFRSVRTLVGHLAQ